MLFTTIYGDNSQFNRLWSYVEHHLDANGLMNWKIGENGEVIGRGSATDADEDIAYALILGEVRWPGHGYELVANKMLHAILAHESDRDGFLLPGDSWNTSEFLNPSYVSPTYYKRFAEVSGDLTWQHIAQVNESWLLKTLFDRTGLAPDWAERSGHFQTDVFGYDAIRVPIRWLAFYRQSYDPQARRMLEQELRTLNTLKQQGLKAGYTLDGHPTVNYLNTDYLASFAAISFCKPYSRLSLGLLWQLCHSQSKTYYGNAMKVWVMSLASNNLH
ncbi:Endoglucanase Y (fragment) [Candidatus Desulfosporosinus infrequens]|uniref:Endoglucanase Y n=1 Tax=Candidatus Desulfosporosinus infrequens TaxID=2043169 RepID=A0A2U3LQV1_9FIRM